MNKHPMVKFGLNKADEKKLFEYFKNDPAWPLPKDLRFMLGKEFSQKEREKILASYVDNYYKVFHDKLLRSVQDTQKDWQRVSGHFFKEVDRLFGGWPWPKGNYRGYLSIWRVFPRDINGKTFTFPHDPSTYSGKNFHLGVIAHEMLHFMAYDYLEKKYKLKPSERSDQDSRFWQFTENLNVLVENTPRWKKIVTRNSQPYPDCKKQYLRMLKIWQNNQSVDNLVEKIFYVSK